MASERTSMLRRLADRGGATAVELALVFPVLVSLIFGTWALGWALYFLCKLAGLGAYLGPVITSTSRPTMGFTAFDYFKGIARGGDFLAFMPTILGAALALAIIASFDALLCAKLVIAPGEPRRDGDRSIGSIEVPIAIGGSDERLGQHPARLKRADELAQEVGRGIVAERRWVPRAHCAEH